MICIGGPAPARNNPPSFRPFLRVRLSGKRFVVAVADFGSLLSEQIDVRTLEKLGRFYAQFCHERLSFLNNNRDRFIFFNDDLKLQEVAETFDAIQVHARSADNVERALLHDAADLAVRQT